MKKIVLIMIGSILIIHSILVWVTYFCGVITIFDLGPTSVFFTANVSSYGNVINFLIFILGVSALVIAIFFMKKHRGQVCP